MVTNDVTTLTVGRAQYACLCYPNGTVVDDVFYYRFSENEFKLFVNASNLEKDYDWFLSNKGSYNIELKNQSMDRVRLAIQGPATEAILKPLVETDLSQMKRFGFAETKLKGIPIFIARTGYTGEDGFEISTEVANAINLWNIIFESGKDHGIEPAGLGARDTLRLEASYSLYGHELSDQITPVEANIGWAVKNKEADFIGKEVLLKQKAEGTDRILRGLELTEKGILRKDYKVLDTDGNEVGYITSGAFSPTLNKTIALAMVKKESSEIGTKLKVQIREMQKDAVVVKTPWVTNIKK